MQLKNNMSEIFSEHYPYFINLLNKKFNHKIDADDAIQDTFLSLCQQQERDIENPRTYLSTSVIHKAIDIYKKGGKTKVEYLEDLNVHGDGEWEIYITPPDTTIADTNELERYEDLIGQLDELKRILPRLPRMKRIILSMRLEGNSNKEVVNLLKLNYKIDIKLKSVEFHMRKIKRDYLSKQ